MSWPVVARALGTWALAMLVGAPLLGVVVAIVAWLAPGWAWLPGAALVAFIPLAFVWAVRESTAPPRRGRPFGRRSAGHARRLANEQVRAPGLDARIKY